MSSTPFATFSCPFSTKASPDQSHRCLVFIVFIFKAPSIYGKDCGLPFIAVMGDLLLSKTYARCLKMSPFEGKEIKRGMTYRASQFPRVAFTKYHTLLA